MYRLFLSLPAAFWAVCSVTSLISPETDSVVMSNSFYSVISFCGAAFLIFHSFSWGEYPPEGDADISGRAFCIPKQTEADTSGRRYRGRKRLFAKTASFLFSLCIVLGTDLRTTGDIVYTAGGIVRKLLQAAGLSFLVSALLLAGMFYLPRTGRRLTESRLSAKLEDSPRLRGKRLFFLSWGLIFLCWIPAFLAYYPGIFSYDVPRQVVEAAEHTYSTHHPLIHTLYLNGSMNLGKMLTGSYTPGVAFYTVTQMGTLSACFAFFCYMTGRKLPALFRIAAVIFFALNPIIHLMAVSATKDTLFSGLMLVCAALLWDMADSPETFFAGKRNPLFLAVSAALMMLFRNNGMYAFLVMAVLLLLILKPFRKQALIMLMGALLLYQGSNRFLIAVCDAAPGSIAEMLSIPLQQIARTLQYESDTVTDEDRNTFYEIIPEQAAGQYYDHLADLVKSDFNEEAFRKAPAKYIRLWLSLGKRHPGCYLNAFLATTLGYWYPDDTCHAYIYAAERHGYLMTQHMGEIINLGDTIVVEKHSFLPWLENLYEEMATWNKHQTVPVISMLFSPGLHCWFLLFTAGLCLCRKEKRSRLIVLALPFGLWLTLLLSPTVLMRYVFPITLFQPFLLFQWMEESPGTETYVFRTDRTAVPLKNAASGKTEHQK